MSQCVQRSNEESGTQNLVTVRNKEQRLIYIKKIEEEKRI